MGSSTCRAKREALRETRVVSARAIFPDVHVSWLGGLRLSKNVRWPILSVAGVVVIVFYCAFTFTSIALFPTAFSPIDTNERLRKVMIMVTQAAGLFSGFALIMIGVFSEDSMAQHVFWSDVFFAFILIVLILANVSLMTHPKFLRPIAYYGFIVALIDLLFVVASNTPVLEWFTVFTALGYVALLSYNTLRPRA
jgi:hypothetical membrane protein